MGDAPRIQIQGIGPIDPSKIPKVPFIDIFTQPRKILDAKAASLGNWIGARLGDMQVTQAGDGWFQVHINATLYAPGIGRQVTYASALSGEILKKYVSLGATASNLGWPKSDVGNIEDAAKGQFCVFEHGGIEWSQATGAHEVHGPIWKRYVELGYTRSKCGYPISGVQRAPNTGFALFSEFHRGYIIYFTPMTGTWVISKAIYDEWQRAGGANGWLGEPTSDAKLANDLGSSYMDFKRGTIYFSGPRKQAYASSPVPPVIEFPVQNFHFPGGAAVNGSAATRFTSEGVIDWKLHFHASGTPTYNYALAMVIVNADNVALELEHSGKVHGTFSSGDRDDNYTFPTTPVTPLKDNWRAFWANSQLWGNAKVNVSIGAIFLEVFEAIGKVLFVAGLISAAQWLGHASHAGSGHVHNKGPPGPPPESGTEDDEDLP